MEPNIDTPRDAVKIVLYHRWLSSCSARLRIALNLLKIPYTYVSVDSANGEQHLSDYQSLNPNRCVPTLVVERTSADKDVIGQSWAALEWLCDTQQSSVSLMPLNSSVRARVRELCMIIIADAQPLTSTRVESKINELGGDMVEWRRFWHRRGLDVYNEVMKSGPEGIRAGKYSVGDEVTLADCILVPAVWKCEVAKMGPEVWREDLPVLHRVYTNLMGLEEVKRAHWMTQVDISEEQRRSFQGQIP